MYSDTFPNGECFLDEVMMHGTRHLETGSSLIIRGSNCSNP